ncbi:uncharacterized protein LOC110850960 [Folsomia candida]|uniref:Pogo transposable element with ZNF domain n=1 Tax=Folsomia candida TaxID=158441 RepID=A0A226E4E5_FOLCA|nr:uncharacterized protein LOC110850960 [Folsomia candida]OXA52602.1 Pogo transposable element with ZNF domain [Folsomia candida]
MEIDPLIQINGDGEVHLESDEEKEQEEISKSGGGNVHKEKDLVEEGSKINGDLEDDEDKMMDEEIDDQPKDKVNGDVESGKGERNNSKRDETKDSDDSEVETILQKIPNNNKESDENQMDVDDEDDEPANPNIVLRSTSVLDTSFSKRGSTPTIIGGDLESEATRIQNEERLSKNTGDSDDDSGVIRIRDIRSLCEDSDDDVIELCSTLPKNKPPATSVLNEDNESNFIIPVDHDDTADIRSDALDSLNMDVSNQVHTPYVLDSPNNSLLQSFSMFCTTPSLPLSEKQRKSLALCKKLGKLSNMLKDLEKKGQNGICVRTRETPTVINVSATGAITLAPSSPNANQSTAGQATTVPQQQEGNNTYSGQRFVRLDANSSQQNSNTVRCIVTSRGLEKVSSVPTMTTTNPLRTYSGAGNRPTILTSSTSNQQQGSNSVSRNMHQVVFDPNTGLLLCPTTQAPPSTAVTASQQFANENLRQYRAVQAPPHLIASLRSGSPQLNRPAAPLMVNGTSLTRVVQQPPATSIASTMMNGATNVNSLSSNTIRQDKTTPVPRPKAAQYTSIAPKAPGSRPIYQPPATAAPVSAALKRPHAEANKPIELTSITPRQSAATNNIPKNNNHNTNTPNYKDKGPSAKTFPSLNVAVKTNLQEKLTKPQSNTVRSELDAKVKNILMQSPVQFTEWLIQKGLIRMDHKCEDHNNPYKLGMYSDSDKYPHSGGYVFTTDCCLEKQQSVFHGSIFEASVYPPSTTMKLIYHWACQTPAPSVLQCVEVNSYYLKDVYTLLRSACVAALHQNASVMGGRGKHIEVSVVTLRTLLGMQVDAAGPMQIEILGVLDLEAKFIRMKLLNVPSTLVGDVAKQERIDQILTPISTWVNRDSVLLIDSSLDKTMIEKIGFRNVSQSESPGGIFGGGPVKPIIPFNVNAMHYLKCIVSNMFANTLCVLSKSLIQQFLDELSWRELWGSQPLKAFDTALLHLAAMTKADTGELLIPRLNKISLNPFAEWSYSKLLPPPSGIECLPDSIRAQPLSDLVASAVGMDGGISSLVSTYMNSSKNSTAAKGLTPDYSKKPTAKPFGSKRKADDDVALDLQKILRENPKTHTLQAYYYVYCPSPVDKYRVEFPSNLKCPLCSKVLRNNTDAISHLTRHVLSAGRITTNPHGCRYCMKELPTQALLQTHINSVHKKIGEVNVCQICLTKYPSETMLIIHMWQRHVNCEAPYRCELCDYRTSFHYDSVDHFFKEHGGSDTVQCPVCLKTYACRSIPCLKSVVTHLQNHILRKGKKCQDCCLTFSTDLDFRAHLVADSAHQSRATKNFVQHEVDDNPIRMPKPPLVNKDMNIPPPKKTKTRKLSGANPNLNPCDRYMFTPMNINISDVAKHSNMNCWECGKPIHLIGHYRGTMKCSRCRFETCCSYKIQKHVQSHDVTEPNESIAKAKMFGMSKALNDNSTILECSGCYFVSGSSRRFAYHLLTTGHRACGPKNCQEQPIFAVENNIADPQ